MGTHYEKLDQELEVNTETQYLLSLKAADSLKYSTVKSQAVL